MTTGTLFPRAAITQQAWKTITTQIKSSAAHRRPPTGNRIKYAKKAGDSINASLHYSCQQEFLPASSYNAKGPEDDCHSDRTAQQPVDEYLPANALAHPRKPVVGLMIRRPTHVFRHVRPRATITRCVWKTIITLYRTAPNTTVGWKKHWIYNENHWCNMIIISMNITKLSRSPVETKYISYYSQKFSNKIVNRQTTTSWW